MTWDKWQQQVIWTANTEFRFVICREATLADFNWEEFRVYFDQGLSPFDALEQDLSRIDNKQSH